MRPVNLLPERHRPRSIRGEHQGSGYIAIGLLGAVLLAVVLYVVTGNQVASRNEEAARAKAEAVQAESRAAALGPFAQFTQIKATREASVRSLASARIDWERTMREVARVLPPKVYLTGFNAGSGASSASSSSSSSTSSSSGAGAAQGPNVALTACAPDQRTVATTLVRLRQLAGAEEVKLGDSSSASSAARSGAASGSSGQAAAACSTVTFNVTVILNQSALAVGNGPGQKVPASLGGGS
jgi:Tfp pilus assembly protein PilN